MSCGQRDSNGHHTDPKRECIPPRPRQIPNLSIVVSVDADKTCQ
jgi:hypothetical protein